MWALSRLADGIITEFATTEILLKDTIPHIVDSNTFANKSYCKIVCCRCLFYLKVKKHVETLKSYSSSMKTCRTNYWLYLFHIYIWLVLNVNPHSCDMLYIMKISTYIAAWDSLSQGEIFSDLYCTQNLRKGNFIDYCGILFSLLLSSVICFQTKTGSQLRPRS